MKPGLVRPPYNFCKKFMGWTLHMIMCVLLCYPVSIYMLQLLSTGRPISSLFKRFKLSTTDCFNQLLSSVSVTMVYWVTHGKEFRGPRFETSADLPVRD